MLEQRIHGHHDVAAQRAQRDQKRHGHPQVAHEHHRPHQQPHDDAQGNHARRLVQPHAHGSEHRPGRRAQRHHAHQAGRLRGAVGQRRARPGQHDVAHVARHAPKQRGGRQRHLPQPVAPQQRVAAPEIGQQRQRVARHGVHLHACFRNVQVEPGRQHVHQRQRGNGGVRRAAQAQRLRGGHLQQPLRNRRPHQLPAQQHAQDDGADRQPLNPAVGPHQLRRRQQLGQDAVLGGRVGRRAQPHHGVRQQRVAAKQHHQAARNLDGVADEHDAPFGLRISERAHPRRQRHVKQRKHRHQRRALPSGRAIGLEQLHRRDKQRVIGQRAAKLRRHDGVKAPLHEAACAGRACRCVKGTACLRGKKCGGLYHAPPARRPVEKTAKKRWKNGARPSFVLHSPLAACVSAAVL